jgi:hypothetical protein
MSRNLRRLKERLKSKDCHFCHTKLMIDGIVIHDIDVNQYFAQCVHCMTVYSHDFSIEHLGVPREIGLS